MRRQNNDWATLTWQLTAVALWLLAKAVLGLARLAATVTTAVIPQASAASSAVLVAALAGGTWALLIGIVAAVSGDTTVTVTGFAIGGVIDLLVAVGIGKRGLAQAAAASGDVELGERSGMLGVSQPHVIPRASRVRHLTVFGPTGSGKSTVPKNLVLQDAAAPGKPGLLCVDVKDDLVTDIAAHLSAQRRADVLLFDPADTAFPPAFNPLADVPPAGRTLAAAELLSALKRLYAESWGPRLEHVLRMVLLTLLETPDATLLDIARLLTDADYRAWAVGQVTNFSVAQFWEHEFPAIVGAHGSIVNVESLLNKLSILAYPEVRNVLGQTRRGLDLRAAMDAGMIVLANLPQGVLGEDAAHFLAALLVGKVQLAAQSRVTLPASERRPFYVFADEFQNYETSAFDKLITEGRSMAVGLVAACQFQEQLETRLRLALAKNCAYGLICRVVDGKHTVTVLKLQEPEAPDAALLVRPLPPPPAGLTGQLARIRTRSRQLLAQPRAQVEQEIQHRQQPAPWDVPPVGPREPVGSVPTVIPPAGNGHAPARPRPPTRRERHADDEG